MKRRGRDPIMLIVACEKSFLKIIKNLWLKDCCMNRRERWWVYLNNNWKIYEIVKVENGMISGDEK